MKVPGVHVTRLTKYKHLSALSVPMNASESGHGAGHLNRDYDDPNQTEMNDAPKDYCAARSYLDL